MLVSVGNPIYGQRKEVLTTIWQKYSAQVYEVERLDIDVIKSVAKGEKIVFVSDNKRLINAVADNLPKARFLIPYSVNSSKFVGEFKKKGA